VVKFTDSGRFVVFVASGAFEVSYTQYAHEAFKYVCPEAFKPARVS
jgi:hypothetical protein